jgi:DNA-binding NarL/FixJ family response regulator
MMRQALAALLVRDKSISIVGEAGSARELSLLDVEYDVLLCDLGLPGPSGLHAITESRRRWPARRILVLTGIVDVARAADAFAAGADGYACKLEDEERLLQAINAVAAGKRWLSPTIDATAVDELLRRRRARVVTVGPLGALSLREREIFDLLVRGYSCQKIGEALFISPRTADTHRTNIFAKLELHSIADLVRFAAREGLLREEGLAPPDAVIRSVRA